MDRSNCRLEAVDHEKMEYRQVMRAICDLRFDDAVLSWF